MPSQTAINGPVQDVREELEHELIEFFSRGSSLIHLPRSVGGIYGVLYASREPIAMDQIAARLNLSTGSISQGLARLRKVHAIRTVDIPGERKIGYVIEENIRQVAAAFLREGIAQSVERERDQLGHIQAILNEMPPGEGKQYHTLVHKLQELQAAFDRLHLLLGKKPKMPTS